MKTEPYFNKELIDNAVDKSMTTNPSQDEFLKETKKFIKAMDGSFNRGRQSILDHVDKKLEELNKLWKETLEPKTRNRVFEDILYHSITTLQEIKSQSSQFKDDEKPTTNLVSGEDTSNQGCGLCKNCGQNETYHDKLNIFNSCSKFTPSPTGCGKVIPRPKGVLSDCSIKICGTNHHLCPDCKEKQR